MGFFISFTYQFCIITIEVGLGKEPKKLLLVYLLVENVTEKGAYLLRIMYLCRDEIRNYCSWRRFTTGSRRCHRTQTIGEGKGRTAHRQINKDFHGK